MTECIDLHTHSTYSDGVLTPTELVTEAKQAGLKAIALTDHDTAAGIKEALAQGVKQNIDVIPGIEVSSWYDNIPIHILGYCFKYDDPVLQERLQLLQGSRKRRNILILEKLKRLGINVVADDLKSYSQYGQAGRPHIAQLLVDKGIVRSVNEAFSLYLKKGATAYVDRFKYRADHAIRMIKEAGGVAVLAHPALSDPSLNSLPALLRSLRDRGMDGVEVYYPTHSGKVVTFLENLAKKFGLVMTGGSDFHGNEQAGTWLGKANGILIPGHLLEKLRIQH